MKYLVGLALFVLSYAVVGILRYQPDQPTHARSSRPAVAVAAKPAPTKPLASFKMISVVADPSPAPSTALSKTDSVEKLSGLTTDIQRRLADATCYNGVVDGVWSDDTQNAAQRFIAAAHAELSSDRPSDSLLALLRSRGEDKSLCALPAGIGQQANSAEPDAARNADALPEFGPPMGLGGTNSSAPSYFQDSTADRSFRHPLGGF